jgi:hypothetical protein
MHNSLKIILLILMVSSFFFSLTTPVFAVDIVEEIIGEPLIPEACTNSSAVKDNPDPNICGLSQMLQVVVNVSALIVAMTGSAALLMFTIGGLMFIIAAGNQERVQKGKAIIQAAVIGMVLVLGAWMIVNAVILALTNGEVGTKANIFGNPAFEEPKDIKP